MYVIITVFFCRTAPDWNYGKEDGLFSPITACIIIKVYHFFYSVYFKWNVFKCSHFPFQAEWTDSGSLERLKCLSKPVSPDSREESVLGSIPLPSYRILYCSPRECRNRKYAFKVSASSCWSSLNLNVLMVSLYTCACRLFIRGCGRTSWALKPRRTCWVGSGLSANQQAWRLMTSSTGEPELSIQNRSICRHSVIYFIDSFLVL